MYVSHMVPSTSDSILAEGLDFILSHFKEPIWPSLLSILGCFILIVDTLETDFLKKGYSSNCQSQYI
jgi:hypothetical protein